MDIAGARLSHGQATPAAHLTEEARVSHLWSGGVSPFNPSSGSVPNHDSAMTFEDGTGPKFCRSLSFGVMRPLPFPPKPFAVSEPASSPSRKWL